MFTRHPMQKVLVTLGLVGGLGLVSDGQAAPRLRTVPTLELVLRNLEGADQTTLVVKAQDHVAAALKALGVPTRVQPLPQPPQGLFVLHNRHKLRRSLVGIHVVQRDLLGAPGAAAAAARSNLAAAAGELEAALAQPFIF